MLTFCIEPWSQVWQEAQLLWPRHYEEVGEGVTCGWELKPQFQILNNLEFLGKLHIVAARVGGKLVGYHASIIEPMLHYSQVLAGKSDLYYLAPEFRNGRNGLRLFQFVEASLRSRGCHVWYEASKLHHDHTRLFQHLGFEPVETRVRKVLEKI